MNTKHILQNISDNNETNQMHTQFVSLFNKVLSALNQQLLEEFQQQILQKCKECTQKSYKALGQIMEFLVSKLVNRIQAQQALIEMDITKSDYQTLELSLQKAQAQIRRLFKIQHQQQIIQEDIDEKLHQQSIKLQKANKTIKLMKTVKDTIMQTIEKYQRQKKEMVNKLEFYQQKLYSLQRQNRKQSGEKSIQKILHKASLQFKNKAKLQPYLESLSKSRQIIFRQKQTSKPFNVKRKHSQYKDSRLLSFQTIKNKPQILETPALTSLNCSISFQDKQKQANSLSDLKSSVLMQVITKKPRNRVLKNLTQTSEK